MKKCQNQGKKSDALRVERRTLEGTGNDKRLEEIKNELEKNEQEGEKLQWGEKVYVLVQQRNELYFKKDLINKEKYDYHKEKDKYEDKDKRLKDLEEENKKINEMLTSVSNNENGLDGLHRERRKLKMEFKKKYGYDEDFAKEASNKLDSYIGERDANRVAIIIIQGWSFLFFQKNLN